MLKSQENNTSKQSIFERVKEIYGRVDRVVNEVTTFDSKKIILGLRNITQKITKENNQISTLKSNALKGVIALGLTFAPNLIHAESSNALKTETKRAKIENTQSNKSIIIENSDASSDKAQKLKKQYGFENISDGDYSKILNAVKADSEWTPDIKKLQSEIKPLQNQDGTLNQEKVKQAGLKYLVTNETSSTTEINTDSKNNETKVNRSEERRVGKEC